LRLEGARPHGDRGDFHNHTDCCNQAPPPGWPEAGGSRPPGYRKQPRHSAGQARPQIHTASPNHGDKVSGNQRRQNGHPPGVWRFLAAFAHWRPAGLLIKGPRMAIITRDDVANTPEGLLVPRPTDRLPGILWTKSGHPPTPPAQPFLKTIHHHKKQTITPPAVPRCETRWSLA